jgi:predicted GIY-YIG superfamily endonuclease
MHYLYRQFDKDGILIYVGRTHDWRLRTYDHRKFSDWWKRVVRIDIERFDDITAACKAEKLAIQTENPVCNFTHSNKTKISHQRMSFMLRQAAEELKGT